MAMLTRRETLLGATAVSLVACAGAVPASGPTPAPPPPPGPPTAPASRTVSLSGQSQAFRPATEGGAGSLRFADQPKWLRRTPALWVPTTESSGAGPIMFSDNNAHALSTRIDSFARLPELLDTAESLGTDTIYVVDWYDGAPGQPAAQYWTNKGDYRPRRDMGGEPAFRRGIEAVRARGGRVVLYVEGFIAAMTSEVGRAHGEAWSIRGPDGAPIAEPYPGNWKLCPAVEGFVSHLEGVARRIGGYGASGIFLDSYGFQQDWVCTAKGHGHAPGDPAAFNRGAIELTRRVGAALQSVAQDGVVLCEGPRFERLLGQVQGTFDWGIHRLVERRIWNCQGSTDTFTIGYSLDDLHQIVAIGGKLTLTQAFTEVPQGASARERLEKRRKRRMPESTEMRHYWAAQMFYETHQWRNAAILAGIPVPGLDDVAPRRGQMEAVFRDPTKMGALIDRLAVRASELDAVLREARVQPIAPTAHVAKLCKARTALAPYLDHDVAGVFLDTGNADVPAWVFEGQKGRVVTAANVSNVPARVRIAGPQRWIDQFSGEAGSGAEVVVPAHGVRLLTPA